MKLTNVVNANLAWEQRITELWAAIDAYAAEDFIAAIDRLVAELHDSPSAHAIALFERACAQDSTGHSDVAVPLYRAALKTGLIGIRRRRANIQLASSLRNLGHAAESVSLLEAELNAASDELDGAVRAFLVLALVDVGREREAVALSLTALSHYLPRYNRSLARYAKEINERDQKNVK
jgi:tetratricopeptide (TPR) repeat protein